MCTLLLMTAQDETTRVSSPARKSHFPSYHQHCNSKYSLTADNDAKRDNMPLREGSRPAKRATSHHIINSVTPKNISDHALQET